MPGQKMFRPGTVMPFFCNLPYGEGLQIESHGSPTKALFVQGPGRWQALTWNFRERNSVARHSREDSTSSTKQHRSQNNLHDACSI